MNQRILHTILLLGAALTAFLSCADYNTLAEDPDAVDLSITSVTDTTVTLHWTQAKEENFGSYLVYMSGSSVVDTTDTLVDSLTFYFDQGLTVSRLRPQTQYFFRVFVRNVLGRIMGSNIVDTMTLRDSRTLFLFEPDSVVDTVAYLRWTRTRMDQNFGRYWICADTTATVDTGTTPPIRISIADIDDTTHTLPGLKRGKTYTCKVHVQGYYDDFIASSNARTISIDTLNLIVPVLSVGNASHDSVWLSWTKGAAQGFKQYSVYSARDTGQGDRGTLSKAVVGVNDTTVLLTGFSDTVQVWFTVYAEAQTGQKARSNEVANYPVILSVESTTDTSVALRWTQSRSREFYAYQVLYDTASTVTGDSPVLTAQPIRDILTRTFTDDTFDSTRVRHYRVFHFEQSGSTVLPGRGSNVVRVE